MELQLANSKNKIEVADDIFACAFNETLVHQIVTAHRAKLRAGTKAQKTRAEVRGGGAKPWRQKGTGQARAGTIRSPIWRKGGRVFAATPRDYTQKVNKKMYKGALRSIISELVRQERLMVVESFAIENNKTKALVTKLKTMNVASPTLIVTDTIEENLYLASRNLPNVQVKDCITFSADPIALVQSKTIIMTQAALKEIEGLLK